VLCTSGSGDPAPTVQRDSRCGLLASSQRDRFATTIRPVPIPVILPQLFAGDGLRTLRAAIAEPDRWAIEPKVDGVRGLVVFQPDGRMETRNRRGSRRSRTRRGASGSRGASIGDISHEDPDEAA
jgi:ATP-dependent DNA ligase